MLSQSIKRKNEMATTKFSDPTLQGESFAMLPVERFNKIMWRSGDPDLYVLLANDPGKYLGEFRSMLDLPATADREAIVFPVLPWPVMKRKAGRDTYSRYSTTEMLFRPITARLRFVLYARDGQGNKIKENNRDVIVSVTKHFVKGSGYSPQKEVFGLVYDSKGNFATHGLLSLDGWSSYISYDRAAKEWDKIATPDGKLVIYRLGTRGTKDNNGETIIKAKTFNGGSSVDIEPLDLATPMLMQVDEAFETLWTKAQEWATCPRWNAEKSPVIAGVPTVTYVDEVVPEFEGDGMSY
jgi:hypothetical protein